jgi:hypothetical protein
MEPARRRTWLGNGELFLAFAKGPYLCGEENVTYSGGVNLVLSWAGDDWEPDPESVNEYVRGVRRELRKEAGK